MNTLPEEKQKIIDIIRKHTLGSKDADYSNSWIIAAMEEYSHEQYLKGYSDGRNGLHNADLKSKASALEKENERLRAELEKKNWENREGWH